MHLYDGKQISSVRQGNFAVIAQAVPELEVSASRAHHCVGFAALGSAVAVNADKGTDGVEVDAALCFCWFAGLERALSPELAGHVLAIVEVRPRHFLQLHEVKIIILHVLFFRLLGHWFEIQRTPVAHCLVKQLKIRVIVLLNLGNNWLTGRYNRFPLIQRPSSQILAGGYLGSTTWPYLIEPPHSLSFLSALSCTFPIAHP